MGKTTRKATKILSLLLGVVMLSACTITQAETTKQRYYAIKTTYQQTLTLVVGYVKYCSTQTGSIKQSCDKNISRIKEMDSDIYQMSKGADLLLESKDDDLLSGVVKELGSQVGIFSTFVKGVSHE